MTSVVARCNPVCVEFVPSRSICRVPVKAGVYLNRSEI